MERTLQLAWAAGFVDGEGYIGITRCFDKKRQTYSHRVQFDIAQVHEAPIRLLFEMFGKVGNVLRFENNKRGYWAWRITGQNAIPVLRELLPYLIVKKEQARLVMEFEFIAKTGRTRATPEDVKRRRAALWAACVELNGGRALHAERASEENPTGNAEEYAVLRPHGNRNRENQAEMPDRLKLA